MPYNTVNDLPKAVRDHLPEHAQEIYLEAYNNALKQYDKPGKRRGNASREETASRVAWAAVKKKYRKNEQTDKWQER
ncbi:MAG: ChaB family protein [Bacteroidota bacterium]